MALSTVFRKRLNSTRVEPYVDYLAFVRSQHDLR